MHGILEPLAVAFLLSLAAPFLHAARPKVAGPALGISALAICGWYLSLTGAVAGGTVPVVVVDWVPSLGVAFSFRLDGLSLLFLTLITGIGGFVLLYASEYMKGNPRQGRLYMLLLLFMASMMGLVLADDLVLLFVFWELTGITSYFLIGFESERLRARAAALQALLITGAGALAMLAGIIIVGEIGGTYSLAELTALRPALTAHGLYPAALLLMIAGAATKSAQVPFHFWLPGAMEAPTPVSAYLHSATMVKAGVYLLARLLGPLGQTPEWHSIVTVLGAATMLVGAFLSLTQVDLKRMLAYSTVSSLGAMILLLGLGTVEAARAVTIFILVHALYKGALFLVAGSVDHESGTRDIERLGGLWRTMPFTAAAAVLAGLSMAGLPPMLGYLSKELVYEAKLAAPAFVPLISALGVGGNVLIAALAGVLCVRVFFGPRATTPREPHEAPPLMVAGPLVLALLGLVLGLTPGPVESLVISPAVAAIHPGMSEFTPDRWWGLDPVFLLSAATIASAIVLVVVHRPVVRGLHRLQAAVPVSAEVLYTGTLEALKKTAAWQTRLLEGRSLSVSITVIVTVLVVLLAPGLFQATPLAQGPTPVRLHEVMIAGAMAAAAVVAVLTRSRFVAVVSVGVVGYGMMLLFALFGAPDLSMTQLAVETLTLVVFMMVLRRLPAFTDYSSPRKRIRDAVIASIAGATITLAILAASPGDSGSALAEYFAKTSLLLANGRNVVNVILVDFRALDTLAEITVLGAAGLGVFVLLRIMAGEDHP
jgi:multicomponent Na+:H+ antiporter subunit A